MTITAYDLYMDARSVLGLNFQDGRLDDNNKVGVMASLNRALSEFCADKDWPFLYVESSVSTVSGQGYITLPAATTHVTFVSLESNLLQQVQRRDSVRWFGVTARPSYFSALNGRAYLTPTPDGVYVINLGYYTQIAKVATPASLSLLSATTLAIPQELIGLVTLYVAKHFSMILKDYDGYKLVNEEIRSEKQKLDDAARLSTAPQAPRTRRDS